MCGSPPRTCGSATCPNATALSIRSVRQRNRAASGTRPLSACRQQEHHARLRAAAQSGRAAAAGPSGKVILYDLYDQLVPYEQAWRWQKQLVEVVHGLTSTCTPPSSNHGGCSGSSSSSSNVIGAALLLQHPPVYTLGAGATEGHLKFDPDASPLPLYRTERGGEVTYHGPGQLVLYPILNLKRLQPDLHWYLRSLEEVVIRALEEVSGLAGGRVPGLTGVWVDGQKVAAIGVRATRWVSYHGLALNVTTDLAPFSQIVPCGISDRPVASVEGLLQPLPQQQQHKQTADIEPQQQPQPQQQQAKFIDQQQQQRRQQQQGQPRQPEPLQPAQSTHRSQQQDGSSEAQLLQEYRHGLVAAFEEVFGVSVEALGGPEALQQLGSLAGETARPAGMGAAAAAAETVAG